DAHVRLDRREGVVGREHLGLRQRVEERRLADVGEPDDADGESHGDRSLVAARDTLAACTWASCWRSCCGSVPRWPGCGSTPRGGWTSGVWWRASGRAVTA